MMSNSQLKIYGFAFLYFITVHDAVAQRVELKELNIPNTPALVLLDDAPTVINRPGTSKAFCITVMSLLTQRTGIPGNFGMEVAPFWFFKNHLDVYHYLGIDRNTNKQTNIFSNLRNISVSVGSVNRDSSKVQPFDANYGTAGVKINPISILPKKLAGALNKTISNIASRQLVLTLPVVEACADFMGKTGYNTCLAKGLQAAFDGDNTLTIYENRLQKLLKVKPLFQLDMAWAGSMVFKENAFNLRHGYRTGIWTTIACNFPFSGNKDIEKLIENKNYLNIFAAARYLTEQSTKDFKIFSDNRYWDIGARLEMEIDQFSVSFESMYRFKQSDGRGDTNRQVGILQYKFNDNFYLSGSFGKNFGTVNNLVALFGLNWGFGKHSILE